MSTMIMETKTNLKPETIAGLQDLLQANIDTAKGFEQVAEEAEAPAVEVRFGDRSRERHENASELTSLLRMNDAEAKSDGSWLAACHRNWIAVKAALTSGGGEALLAEIERGERYLVDKYDEVVADCDNPSVNDMLHRQLAKVREVIALVKAELAKRDA